MARALPKPSTCGVVEAAEVATGGVCQLLKDPELASPQPLAMYASPGAMPAPPSAACWDHRGPRGVRDVRGGAGTGLCARRG
eukprot:11195520-Lingulodinium_polyedra.AAC.1